MKSNRYSVAGFACAVLAAAGCASAPKLVEVPTIQILNIGARAISLIEAKRCGTDDSSFRAASSETIPPRRSLVVRGLAGCVDLRAITDNGVIAGRQDGMTVIPGTTWTIR